MRSQLYIWESSFQPEVVRYFFNPIIVTSKETKRLIYQNPSIRVYGRAMYCTSLIGHTVVNLLNTTTQPFFPLNLTTVDILNWATVFHRWPEANGKTASHDTDVGPVDCVMEITPQLKGKHTAVNWLQWVIRSNNDELVVKLMNW